MKRNNLLAILGMVLGVFMLFSLQQVSAQGASSSTFDGGDAIAVRVIPNPNHYSVYRWYESQGFTGSPQALTVDGYEAIRDGRTVYVNAANILTGSKKAIYTNIYLISYNQDPNVKTVDILGQIVSHWKFNDNLASNALEPASCSISSLSCDSDDDCFSGQTCAESGKQVGSCVLNDVINCSVDDECPNNFFCNSVKAKVIRDIKRVGKVQELKEALAKYKDLNGHYPKLTAGTYIPNHTVSVWPSWTDSFLSNLAVVQSFIDPINSLGNCPDFDKDTCWSGDTKRFVYDPNSSYLKLPSNSYALVYSSDANGSDYSLCAVMESRDQSDPLLGYSFVPNDPTDNQCVTATGVITGGGSENTAPRILTKALNGEAGQEYIGFVRAVDDQDNPMTWSLSTNGTNWSAWGEAPVLVDVNDPNQKKIYSSKAGGSGMYNTTLTITDSEGARLTTNLVLNIDNQSPFIEADSASYVLDPAVPLDYNLFISDTNIERPVLVGGSPGYNSYSLTKVSGPFDILKSSGIIGTVTSEGINRYKINYRGKLSTSYDFSQDTDFVYRVKATDAYQVSSTKEFTLTVLADDPFLKFDCPTEVRIGQSYSCKIGPTKQGNHSIIYTGRNLPNGLKLKEVDSSQEDRDREDEDISLIERVFQRWGILKASAQTGNSVYLMGEPSSSNSGEYQVEIKGVNEYGVQSEKSFSLKVNNYCGDGIRQFPNLEGRGGFYNDGYEDCDGNSMVATSAADSSIDRQYGCATEVGTNTPYPILDNNYCIFKSPLNGGGFCGDTYCQTEYETIENCARDCSADCEAKCDGRECGSDSCSGSCGPSCGEGQTCNSNGICELDCQPQCDNKECGDNGCLGNCPNTCTNGKICDSENYKCVDICDQDEICETERGEHCSACSDCRCTEGFSCTESGCVEDVCPNTCGEWVCGEDDCGNSCGTCTEGKFCNNGACENNCEIKCEGKDCGSDSCGGSCGACYNNEVCTANDKCCAPDCENKTCGSNGCGGTCGPGCSNNETCFENQCCTPTCAEGQECGSDGCGGTCGNGCGDGEYCSDGQCVCQPSCSPSVPCGDDGCGGYCDYQCIGRHGVCNYNDVCKVHVACADDMDCGNDMYGNSCGHCPSGEYCRNGKCWLNSVTPPVCDPYCTKENLCRHDNCFPGSYNRTFCISPCEDDREGSCEDMNESQWGGWCDFRCGCRDEQECGKGKCGKTDCGSCSGGKTCNENYKCVTSDDSNNGPDLK